MPLLDNLRVGDLSSSSTFPEGIYTCRCNKATFNEAKVAENPGQETFPYVGLDLVITGPMEEYVGRHVFENALTLKPGSNWRLREVCIAFGVPEDEELVENPGTDDARFRTEIFDDRECMIAVGIEKERTDKRTGRSYPARNKINKYLPMA